MARARTAMDAIPPIWQPSPRTQSIMAMGLAALIVLFNIVWSTFGQAATLAIGAAAALGACLLYLYPFVGVTVVALSQVSPIWVTHSRKLVALLLVMLPTLATKKALSGDLAFRMTPFVKWALALFVWQAVSLLWADVYSERIIFGLIYSVLVILIVGDTVRTRKDAYVVFVAASLGMGVTGSLAVFHAAEFISLGPVEAIRQLAAGEAAIRFTGGWGGPNTMASSIVPVVPLCIAVVRSPGSRILRVAMALCGLLGVLAIVLSLSRSAMLCFAVMTIVLSVTDRRQWLLVGGTVAVVGISMLVLPVDVAGRMSTLASGSRDASLSERGQLLRGGIELIEDSFPFGVGAGNAATYAPDYVYSLPASMNPHNAWVEVMAETGVVGLLLFVGAILSLAWQLRLTWTTNCAEPFLLHARSSLTASLAAMLVAYLFNGFLRHPSFWMILVLLSTTAAAYEAEKPRGLCPADTDSLGLSRGGAC